MTAIRLLLAEVDSALLTPDGRLTARARRAAARLRGVGVELAITSARPPRGMRRLVGPLGITTPLGAFDGGRLVGPDLSLLEEHPLDDRAAMAIVAALTRCGSEVWVYQGDEWLVRRTGAAVALERATVRFPPRTVPRWEGVLRDALKIVAISDDAEALARCEAELGDLYGCASAVRARPDRLVVMHPRANPGEVARALSRRLGIPAEAIATLGGAPSDVLMFRECGLRIAMGHARAALQREADFITRSNEDEGFAYAVETWLLAPVAEPRAAG